MVQGLRYLAYFVLVIAGFLGLVGTLSFLTDVPGMTVNGRRVESLEDKILFVSLSITLGLGALASIVILRREVLQRNHFVWRAAYWAETLPSANSRGRTALAIGTAALTVLATLAAPSIQPGERLVCILLMPLVFTLGFGGSLLVLGVQVHNPLCPEPLLRAFALISFAFFAAGTVMSIPQAVHYSAVDPGALLVPPCALGFAYGAAFVLRRWTRFEPLLEPPAA